MVESKSGFKLTIFIRTNILFCLLLITPIRALSSLLEFNFKHISTSNGLPSNEVQKVFQDREGFIWFATRYGFCKYDGYQVTTFKSDLNTPSILTNNNIVCITDDANRNIWLGTFEGLNVYNKESGEIKKCNYPGINNNQVLCLLVTTDNTLWVGNQTGLFRYDRDADKMILYSGAITNHMMPETTITYLFEDSDGDIWIGTRSEGLLRYDTRNDIFYRYAIENLKNTHIIFEDSDKHIWVIGWDEGLFLLKNPKDMEHVSWINYRHTPYDDYSLQDNMAYDMYEDLNTKTLWVGTRSGLSIISLEKPEKFINYKTIKRPYNIPFDEANSIIRDKSGNMWIGTIGNGVYIVDTKKPEFNLYQFKLQDESITTTSIRSIYVDDDEYIWFGIGTYGIARYDRKTNRYTYFTNIPEFSKIQSMPTVYTILKRKQSNEFWFGTYDGGLFVYQKGELVRHYNQANTDFIIHSCITALYEDSKGNCWIGTREGISVKRADGTGHLFNKINIDGKDLSTSYIRKITEDKDNKIWIATNNHGIISISGELSDPDNITYARYSYDNDKIKAYSVQTLLLDSKGRLWAGTEGYGLFLYNKELNRFESKNAAYNLPCDMIGSIEEDSDGCLWLGTNIGLMRLNISTDAEKATIHIYTATDGLQNDFFIPRSSFVKNGEMFFGGYNGFNSFFPDSMEISTVESPLFITDIKIFNTSLSAFDKKTKAGISAKEASYTDKITLSHKQNNFSIEFASLTYKNPELNKYAYKLEGFDTDWLYTDANNHHFAYYNNLKSGKYTFRLHATNENGIWGSQTREIGVIILPPPWATWWAYLGYVILILIFSFLIYRNIKNRIVLKNSLQLQKMEQSKVEELNHSKLQFFTNVTHELLTPLSIISASVEELQMNDAGNKELYHVMTNNVNRLIRLLQQILEFRKAESGNLKLKVSKADLAQFVRNSIESFRPLIKKKELHLSLICNQESIFAYFDFDKMDKILYNLLSNAAKYNEKGGTIMVELEYDTDSKSAIIKVNDNGKGLSPEAINNLFKRFYEGDYRKFNTIGTGIGLSLTRDLVELHKGKITVSSVIDQGTTFTVTIPVDRDAYQDKEIDDIQIMLPEAKNIIFKEEKENAGIIQKKKQYSLLIIEDNEDIAQLLERLLNEVYNVKIAGNGKEGLELLKHENVDLIISDIMMPEIDGIEFCRIIKNDLNSCHIPILLLTAKNLEEDRVVAYNSGADAYISKPFSLSVLHARINNLLKAKERNTQDFKKQFVFEANELNYTSMDESFLQKAIDLITENLDNAGFDQQTFIEVMGTSKSTLHRKIKSLTGLNTSSFIRNIRLKAACRLMESKRNIRISELAYAVGFNDPKYFSVCFKKEFGMQPSEYLEQLDLKSKN